MPSPARALKRALDVACAGAGLIATAPFFAAVALAVRKDLGSPVLFRQERAGQGGKLFTIWKFRTMRDAQDAQGRALPDDERLTPLGRLLRSASLDELPQLVNVLRGEMSLVGPRPLLPRYLPRYTAEQARRHEVPPGITGWAQVRGRNALTWNDKLALDVWYVDHWSLWLDAKILVATFAKVLARSDVSAAGEATMSEFWGTEAPPATPLATSR